MECPIGGPRCFEGCAKENLALNYSPMSYTTERPSVPYRSVGSGGTDAHICGGGRKPLPETPVRHAHTALVCQVHDPARGINPLAARLRGTELLRQPPLQHLQAVLAPEQLALEHVGRNA